jgi:serine/threonine protein kinase
VPAQEALAAYVMREVLQGLEHLHAQGWVHRDVKSDNVLVGGGGAVKLADMGFAVRLDREQPSRWARAPAWWRCLHPLSGDAVHWRAGWHNISE